jgi:predicted alpha/beta-fold hydrolase
MLVALFLGGLTLSGLWTLRFFFGPGEEEAPERVHAPPLAGEITLATEYTCETGELPLHRTNDVRVCTQTWYPSRSAKGIVVFLHGMNGHGGQFTPFFKVLLKDDWITACMDFRGFGRSAGRHGYLKSIADVAEDAKTFLHHLHERHAGLPLFLFGGYILNHIYVKTETTSTATNARRKEKS